MLKRVSIQNFKSLKDVTLDLQKVNLLIGPNNSGKTNFLKALEFYSKNIYSTIDNSNPLFPKDIQIDSNNLYKKDTLNTLYIHFVFNNDSIIGKRPQLSLFTERGVYQHFRLNSSGNTYYHEHWYNETVSINSKSYYGREYTVTKNYLDLFFEGINIFTINPHQITQPCPLYPDGDIIKPDTSNVVAFLDSLRDTYPVNYATISESIFQLIPDLSQILFKTVLPDKNQKKIHGERTFKKIGFLNKLQNVAYWAEELSEGTLYFLALLCIINQPTPPKLLLLEEPEKGIHPRRIFEVIQFIFQLAEEKDVQVIMTTHSPIVVDMFKDMPESVFIFDKDNEGATHVKNLQRDVIEPEAEKSKELGIEPHHYTDSLGDAWTVGFLGGVPK